MLFSIIFAVVAALLVIIAEAMFESSDANISDYGIVNFVRESITSKSWEKAIIIGLIVGAIRYFAPMASWAAIVCFIATIGLMGYLCRYWHEEGSEIRELVIFVLLAILVFFAGGKATSAVAGLIKGGFLKFVLGRLPLAVLVSAIGYMICNFLHYRSEEYAEDDEEEALYSRWTKIVAVLTAVAVILVFAIGANWSAVNFGHKKAEDPVATETVASTEEPEDWFGFYNTNLLLDDEPSNDFNFGWNPYDENTVGKSYDEDLRSRMKIDPALGAATLAWFDANVGTRFIGVFYDEVDHKWDAAINTAKERFMADQDEYNRTLEAFFKYLDASVKEVKVEEKKNIADQMYMNPYTSSGTPDVIVVETPDHEGHFLIYTLKVKETGIFEVAFRIDCGYQPCNVAEIMHVIPQPAKTVTTKVTETKKTTTKTTSSGSKSSGGGSVSGSKASSGGSASGGRASGGSASGGNSSTVWYGGGRPSGSSGLRGGGGGSSRTTNPKDTTKGTDVGKNDTTGPGPNTNNGIGATGSSAELPTNSSKKSSVGGSGDSYDAAIEQNKEANRTTRTGSSNGSSGGGSSGGAGSSNTPSSTRSGTDNVDSNAEKGTGHGGIDTPTTKTETHVQTSDGSTHSVSNDSPGTSWSGPVD